MSLVIESYERIVENLYDGLYFVDRDRIIRFWNKAAEQISGFAANDVVYLGGFPSAEPAGSDVAVYISGSMDRKLVVNSEMVVTGAISFAGAESGLILTSPNGTMFALTVDDDGNLGTMQI